MRPLRVAVIGTGALARSVHLPSLAEMDDVEIVALCDIVESRARDLAEQYNVEQVHALYQPMLEQLQGQVDAMFVLVEPGNLFHVVWRCLDAGFPTYMEKPPGATLFQCESLARKSDESGCLLQVGFNRRFIPLVREVKELADQHGHITQVEGCFYKYGSGSFDRGSTSAFVSDTIHAVDLVRWLAGGEPVKTASVLAACDEPFPNAWSAVSRFDNGVTGVVKGHYMTGGRVHKFEVHGASLSVYMSLGIGESQTEAIVLTREGKAPYSLAAAGGVADDSLAHLDGKALAGSEAFHRYYGFYQEDRHFLDCVRTGAACEASIQDAVETFRWVEAIQHSAI